MEVFRVVSTQHHPQEKDVLERNNIKFIETNRRQRQLWTIIEVLQDTTTLPIREPPKLTKKLHTRAARQTRKRTRQSEELRGLIERINLLI